MKHVITNFLILAFLFFSANTTLSACWQGCVVDQCSGKPLADYPITYCNPNANGGAGGCTTIKTGPNGCFSYSGAIGSSLTIGTTRSVYYGGPCKKLGTIRAYGLVGPLSLGSTALFNGNPFSMGVWNSQVHGCNENNLNFSYTANGIDLSKYCIKVEIYKKTNSNLVLEETIDWTPFEGKGGHSNFDFTSILENYPAGVYQIKVSIKCCYERDPKRINGYNVFSGSFVWNPSVQTGDAEFNWIGSAITEMVNNDGNNDNTHPNDGTIWELGAASVGVNWLNVTGSAAVTKISYRLERSENCSMNFTESIASETIFPANGTQLTNLSFNSWTLNYFVFGGPMINIGQGNIPNPFPIKYQYDDCFRFTVKVWGSSACPPKEFSGTFTIYDGDASAKTSNTTTTAPIQSQQLENIKDPRFNIDLKNLQQNTIAVYPNPTSGTLELQGVYLGDTEIKLFDQHGRLVDFKSLANNSLDISELDNGIYYLNVISALDNSIHKVIKVD